MLRQQRMHPTRRRQFWALLGWSGDGGFVPRAGVGSDSGEDSALEWCPAGGELDLAAVGAERLLDWPYGAPRRGRRCRIPMKAVLLCCELAEFAGAAT